MKALYVQQVNQRNKHYSNSGRKGFRDSHESRNTEGTNTNYFYCRLLVVYKHYEGKFNPERRPYNTKVQDFRFS